MPEENREWKLPKNVRQMGDGGADRKIYIEDYVITFLESLAQKGQWKKGVLFGELRQADNVPYVFVNGAIETESFSPDEETRQKIQGQMEKYFGGKTVVGWFLSSAESPFVMTREITETFQREFSGEQQILLVRDSEEKENYVFVLEDEAAAELPGYYVYYEKNPAMQEYMVSVNAGQSVDAQRPVKDDAIKRFRQIVKEKNKLPKVRFPSVGRLAYLAGGFLVVTVMALGVTMVYNYDKMKEVEQSLARLTNNVDSQSRYLEEDADTAPVMLHLEDEAALSGGTGETKTAEPQSADNAQNGEENDALAGNSADASGNASDAQTSGNATDVQTSGNATDAQTSGNAADAQTSGTVTDAQTSGTVTDVQTSGTVTDAQASGSVTDEQTSGTVIDVQTSETVTDIQTSGAVADMPEDIPVAAVARASYTVKMGDTLAGISEMYYGDLEKIAEICELNGIEDENTILPGQKIILP